MKRQPKLISKIISLTMFFFAYCLIAYAQTTVANFDFESATSYSNPGAIITVGNVQCSMTGTETFSTTAGVATSVQAFTANSGTVRALQMTSSNGNYTKSYTFHLSGSDLQSYVSYRVYCQTYCSNTAATNVKLSYSTDGISYFDLTSDPILLTTNVWEEQVFNLSVVSEINYSSGFYVRISVSSTGTSPLKFDNFQVQGNYVSPENAKLKDYSRGMYVNDFIKFIGNPDDQIVDLNLTILGNDSKENELLNFARESNFTYLLLYDLYPLWKYMGDVDTRTGITFGDELCKFMNKAQNEYCIHRFGVAGSAKDFFEDIMTVNQSPVFHLTSVERARLSSQSPLLIVEDETIHKGDSKYLMSEFLKFMLAMTSFNTPNSARFSGSSNTTNASTGLQCNNSKFDVICTEWEFWLDRNDEGFAGPSQKYPYFKELLRGMNDIKNLQEANGNIIYTEAYVGYLEREAASNWANSPYIASGSAASNQEVANEVDPLLDRILSTYYFDNEYGLYNPPIQAFSNRNYQYKFLSFGRSTPLKSVIQPLFNSELMATGGQSNYFGLWFTGYHNGTGSNYRDPRSFNVFTAERDFYEQWHADADPIAQDNDIQPGSSHWYSSESLMKNISHPMTFRSNSPVCVASGQTGNITFTYQGPINKGLKYDFSISADPGNLNTPPAALTNQAWPIFNIDQFNQSHSIELPAADLEVGNWHAHLKLYYENSPGQCEYQYDLPVIVSTNAVIEAYSNTTFCQGGSIILHASQGTGYLWSNGSTKRELCLTNPSSGIQTYTCQVSGGGCSNTISSITINVLPNYVPFTIYPPEFIVSNCDPDIPGATISLNSPNAAILWSDGTTGNSISYPEGGTYSVQFNQNANGCESTYKMKLIKPTIDLTPGFNNIVCNNTNTTSIRVTNLSKYDYSDSQSYDPAWNGGSVELFQQGNPIAIHNWIAKALPPLDFVVGPGTYTLVAHGRHYDKGSSAQHYTTYCMTSDPIVIATLADITVTSPTVCQNQYTSLVCSAMGPDVTYDWGGGNIKHFLTVNPTTAGTFPYSCSVTLAGCSTVVVNGTVTSIASPVLSMSTPSATSNCTATASVTATGGTGFTYNWGNNGAATSSLSALCPGEYNVVVTNSSGCSSSGTASVIAGFTTCPAGLDIYAGQKSSDIISFATYSPGAIVSIHGDFIIDQDFSFLNSEVIIDDGVNINIDPGKKLIAQNSTLRACNTMWHGINLSSDASALIVKQGSTIRDAETAVDASNGAHLSLMDSHFIHNLVSLDIHDGNFFYSEIYGNEFYYLNPIDYKDPTAAAHIRIRNVTDIVIGAVRPTLTANEFYNGFYGIYIESSNVLIQYNDFHNLGQLQLNDAMQWVNVGNAIRGVGYSNKIEIRGSNLSTDQNSFHHITDQGTAISLDGSYEVSIYGNYFENLYGGVNLYKINDHIVDVHNNVFLDYSYGISAFDLDNCVINISENSLNMVTTSNDPTISEPMNYDDQKIVGLFGIDFQCSSRSSSNIYNCHNNWIANTRYSTHIRNIESLNATDVNIQRNQIYFKQDPSDISGIERGIWMENCVMCNIANNHIESKFPTPTPDYERRLVGIEFLSSTYCQITENYIGQMGYSLYGAYTCSGSELHCNNFESFGNGIMCKKLDIPFQGNNPIGVSWDNEWNGLFYGNWIGGDLALASPFDWYYLVGAPEQDIAINPIIGNINPVSGNDDLGCSAPEINTSTEFRERYFEKTAYGQNTYSEDELFHEYYEKVLFYSGLKKNPALLTLGTADDIIYQTLYDNLDNGNIGMFEKINAFIKEKDYTQANALLSQIVDENIVELYKKIVSQILIDKEIAQRELTSAERTALESIAYELGIYGGEAVYMARAMLKIFVDDNLSLARSKAPDFYTNKKSEVSTISSFIYPNPANKEVHLMFSKPDQEEKYVTILNSYGETVKFLKWEKNIPIFTLNTEAFSPGIYNISVSINNESSQTNKLVVIH